MKRLLIIGTLALGAWSCATYAPTPPSFYIQDIPPAIATGLTLDQRIAASDAWAAMRSGRAEQARKILTELGADNPVYAVGLGYYHLITADLQGAESDFVESLRTTPDMTPANVGLAQIYASRGEDALALAQYREILKTDPENRWAKPRFEALKAKLVDSLSAEARAALAAGNTEEAKKAFLKVLFYAPESGQVNLELARIYRQEKNVPSARLHYQSALEAEPENKALMKEYADFLYDAGDFGQSLDAYQSLAQLEPQDKAIARRIEDLKTKLGVFELPSQYQTISGMEAITREDLAALLAVKFNAFLNVPARQTQIMVDIATSWAQKFIIKVASLNVMAVYDNHTFQPRKIINRAELAEAVDKLIGFLKGHGVALVPLVDTRRIQVADVSPDNYFYQSIVDVLSYQVMDLSPDRLFEPERTVSGPEAERVLDLVLRLAK